MTEWIWEGEQNKGDKIGHCGGYKELGEQLWLLLYIRIIQV
jgi:hypothetical protein